jgi:hypothetical protein
MRKNSSFARSAAWLIGGAAVAIAFPASAATCPSPGPNVVYLNGSSAFSPVLAATQKILDTITINGTTGIQLVYLAPGSCEGLGYILGHGGAPMPDVQDSNKVSVFPGGTKAPCSFPAADAGPFAGYTADIGISDVWTQTCQGSFLSDLNSVGADGGTGFPTAEFLGPIQAMTFAVPKLSSADSISAEAAYMVFGFDANPLQNLIAPWVTPGHIYTRFWDSGTLEMIATAIGLNGGKWANSQGDGAGHGPDGGVITNQASGSGAMETDLTNSGTPNDTIGILGAANIYESNAKQEADGGMGILLKPLAFQAKGQSCAFYPDSSSNSTDKLNVRQGRYEIWGPEHLIVGVDGTGNPVGQNGNTAAVQAVITALTATMTGPATTSSDAGAALTDAQIGQIIDAISVPASSGGVVPWCAMEVQRTTEVGPLSSYQSPYPCTCRYTAASTGTPPSTCTACTSDTQCTSASLPHCRYGYCEAN